MILNGKNVLVFAATGTIGSVTAEHLAYHGAHVWASGRDPQAVETLAAKITAGGGAATAHVVDATDEAAVLDYVALVAGRTRIDGAFNAIGATPQQLGYPAVATGLDLETFLRPHRLILGSTFLTSRAVAPHLTATGGGSLVTLSATLTGSPVPWMSALTATCGAIEFLTRQLATEWGPAGVRVNCVRSDALPASSTIQQTTVGMAALAGVPVEAFTQTLPQPPLGPVTPLDTASSVAFLLSDLARSTSGQVLTVAGRAMVG